MKIQVGHYLITEKNNGTVWTLHIKSIEGNIAICDWSNDKAGHKVRGRRESIAGLSDFYNNGDWIIERVSILPEDLFTI